MHEAAALERAMAEELAAAKAAHEAAELAAAELATNAANVMQLLSAQLTAEREARCAAEDALCAMGGEAPARPRRRDGAAGALAPFLAPGVLRGVAAGLACGFAARFGNAAVRMLMSRVTDKTGIRADEQAGKRSVRGGRQAAPRAGRSRPPPPPLEEEFDEDDGAPPPPRYRRSHY